MTLPAAATAIVLLFAQSAPVPTQQQAKASIEGMIVRIGTGEPIAGARVMLAKSIAPLPTVFPSSAPANLPTGTISAFTSSGLILPNAAITATTDNQGRFTLKDLDASSYRLTVAANGYARQEYGQKVFGGQGTPINLVAGQSFKDVVVRLTPAGNVNGRINDESGNPAVGVQVQLLRASYGPTGQKTFQSAGTSRTNDRGEYRLYWVTPGRYYLNAGSPPGPTRPLELGGVGESPNGVQESYGFMYYPGALDIKDAAILDVQPGVELNAIDFSIPRQQLYRIRGRVVDARTGQRPAAVTMTLSSRSLTGGSFTSSQGQSYNPADGTFELRNVAPGSYSVGAQIQEGVQGSQPPIFTPGAPSRPNGAVSVTVFGSDVDGLTITIAAGVSIPGRIRVESQAMSSITGLDRIRVVLGSPSGLPSNSQQMPMSQPVNADGTFREDNVFPGEYRVSVAGLPPGFYVKDVRFDQTDVLNKLLQFSGSVPGPIEVILSPKAAEIEGKVMNDRQEAVPGIQAVLIPDQHRDRIDLYTTALTNQTGQFTFRGIPPGDYKIFAWEAIEQFSYFDPDVVQRFESRGKPLHVSESDKLTAEVKAIVAGQE